MKKIILVLGLLAFAQAGFAKDAETHKVVNPMQIDTILSTYVLFSNKILAKGMAFGFTPVVQSVDIALETLTGDPEAIDCQVTLVANLGALEDSKITPVSADIPKPMQTYTEESGCEYVKEQYSL